MSENKNRYIWLPFLLAAAVCIGIYVGNSIAGEKEVSFSSPKASGKIDQLIKMIDIQYVDTINTGELIEGAIPTIVSELDPHSVYIPAKDLQATNEELEGSFSGIGVQFNIQNDTVMVIAVIAGGPSEKIGLMAGDRIVAINDSAFVGKEVSNDLVMKKLKGQKGTEVKLGIKRGNSDHILDYNIIRGDIPVTSIDAAYLLNDNTGYIKVGKFGRTTYNEFVSALAKTSNEGATQFVIDLRGNSGGYMDMAINMINEFLPKGQLIVYTHGKSVERSDAYSNGHGSFQKAPVVVLIDEWSASASEIFAGAIQDNDRGTIIGRRSFGKGLVQQQYPFKDGSAIRLTIARYYTPSGRSIQKEYELGKGTDYQNDLVNRFSHGEFYSKDSIHLNDSLKYNTLIGRTVYGGGGIMPDIFVPSDTLGSTPYLNSVSTLLYQFAFRYSDSHRDELQKYDNYESLLKELKSRPILEEFVTYAESKGIKRRPVYINISKDIINRQLQSYILRNIQGEESFYKRFLQDDKTITEAMNVLNSGTSFPTLEK